jgi:deazaflavin-dependent oxidoreductase (nitroreductase family)
MPIITGVVLLLAILLAPILLIRFRKRWVAAFNLAVTNRITSRFADRLPGFGILTHVGRKSGKVYRTPVNVFRAPEGFLVALTYGRDSEWVKNVLVAGGCELETRGVEYRLSAPAVVHDPTRRRFPRPVRMVLRIIGANDFMQLSTSRVPRGFVRIRFFGFLANRRRATLLPLCQRLLADQPLPHSPAATTSSPTQSTCFRCPKCSTAHAYRRKILYHSCLATLGQERVS